MINAYTYHVLKKEYYVVKKCPKSFQNICC